MSQMAWSRSCFHYIYIYICICFLDDFSPRYLDLEGQMLHLFRCTGRPQLLTTTVVPFWCCTGPDSWLQKIADLKPLTCTSEPNIRYLLVLVKAASMFNHLISIGSILDITTSLYIYICTHRVYIYMPFICLFLIYIHIIYIYICVCCLELS